MVTRGTSTGGFGDVTGVGAQPTIRKMKIVTDNHKPVSLKVVFSMIPPWNIFFIWVVKELGYCNKKSPASAGDLGFIWLFFDLRMADADEIRVGNQNEPSRCNEEDKEVANDDCARLSQGGSSHVGNADKANVDINR